MARPRLPGSTSYRGASGEHAHNGIKIDPRVRVRAPLPLRPVELAHLNLPPHSRRGDRAAHAAELVQLHDLALLSVRMSADDWAEFAGPIAHECGLWWALAPLLLTERYYGPVPAEVLGAAAVVGCRCPLRRSSHQQLLRQVSFSDLRRSGFAGIEWSRSTLEVLAYAAQRAALTARVLTGRSSPAP